MDKFGELKMSIYGQGLKKDGDENIDSFESEVDGLTREMRGFEAGGMTLQLWGLVKIVRDKSAVYNLRRATKTIAPNPTTSETMWKLKILFYQ